MPSLLENLRKDHENLARLLGLFERELSRFEQAKECDYERIFSILEYCVKFPDHSHHPLEDMVFASLRRRDTVAVEPIGDLRNLHQALAAQTRAVISLVDQARQEIIAPRADLLEAGRRFVQTYRDHMQLEDEHFFPAAEQTLTQEDWAEIEAAWLGPFDPALTARAELHYRRLCQELLAAEEELDAS